MASGSAVTICSGEVMRRQYTETVENSASAFSAPLAPLVSDWRNYGQWAEDGARTAGERATGIWQRTLAEFVPPTQDSAALEAVGAYVRRQEERGGALPVS